MNIAKFPAKSVVPRLLAVSEAFRNRSAVVPFRPAKIKESNLAAGRPAPIGESPSALASSETVSS